MAEPRRTVTALRERRGSRVLVELDGEPWRELPADAVVRAGLSVGLTLDRPRLRQLRRELQRSEALAAAGRALRTRDLSTTALSERLARAGVPKAARAEALETLTRVGAIDDARLAAAVARGLADREWGDAAIVHRLEQLGVERDAAMGAIAALDPEEERVARAVRRRGRTVATGRALARRGFSEHAVEGALSDVLAETERAR